MRGVTFSLPFLQGTLLLRLLRPRKRLLFWRAKMPLWWNSSGRYVAPPFPPVQELLSDCFPVTVSLSLPTQNIEARLKVALPSDLGPALTDGVVLCHLANHVRPRSVPSIHVPSPAVVSVSDWLAPQDDLCRPLMTSLVTAAEAHHGQMPPQRGELPGGVSPHRSTTGKRPTCETEQGIG